MRALVLAPVLALGIAAGLGASEVRGITISTHTDGREYGGPAMPPTLERIRSVGANWVAIHPYASIGRDGSVRIWRVTPDADPFTYVERAVNQAHAAGLSIFVKPHLAYWGSPFSWRGEIEFPEEASRRRFWREYEAFIVGVAGASHAADGFAVGTELDRFLEDEEEWRHLVARVRAVTPAPLTYAANWTDYQRVPFWDALDAIGIQGYFPLTETADPDEAEIRAGWRRRLVELEAYARAHGRSVVLTELGYGRSFAAAARPWSYENDGAGAERVQLACLRVALEEIARSPAVIGAFLWKWFPEPRPVGRNFQLATPAVEAVIRGVWLPVE